jgi:hypothetical protein
MIRTRYPWCSSRSWQGIPEIDRHAKIRKRLLGVIPAKAGIQNFNKARERWAPAFAGVTIFFAKSSLVDPVRQLFPQPITQGQLHLRLARELES